MRIAVAALLGLSLAAVPAHARVHQQSDTGFVVRHGVEVIAPPQEVWAELLKPSGWWSSQHTFSGDAANLSLDPRAGGCFCEVLPDRDSPRAAPRGSVEHMHVVYVEEARALRMTGGLGPLQSEAVTGSLTVTLKPVDGGTRILWEYVVGGYMRFQTAQIAPSVDAMLGEQVQWLALKLGTMPPRADASPPDDAETQDRPAAQDGEEPDVEATLEKPAPMIGR